MDWLKALAPKDQVYRQDLKVYLSAKNFAREVTVIMSLRERENRIFRKYPKPIVRDGALGKEYESARRRVLVILKEPNDPDGGWAASGGDSRDFGIKGKPHPISTWKALASWSALIDDPSLSFEQINEEVTTHEKRVEHLRRIAVVNLKKTSGKSTSRHSEIRSYAEQHWALLRDQFRLYKPHLTIAGNVFPIVKEQMDIAAQQVAIQQVGEERFSFFKHPDFGVFVDFWHPNQRSRSHREILNQLKRVLRYHGFTD